MWCPRCRRGVQPESWEHWPLGDKREEAEVKQKIEVPKGSEGSRERMLEARQAEDFKEAANRISMVKQLQVRVPTANHRELVILVRAEASLALQRQEVWDFLSSPCVCDGKEMGQKLTGLRRHWPLR